MDSSSPPIGLVVILGSGIFLLFFVVATYNRLVGLRNYIRDARANIDTELKRRYDLIPNLVETVKAYAAHEREVFENVTKLRARCQAEHARIVEQGRDETELSQSLSRLLALSESYPELKADEQFLGLQTELVNTEDRIQAARRFFNGNVRDYRNACEQFPSSLIASGFGFQSEAYFDVDPSVREVPSARFS